MKLIRFAIFSLLIGATGPAARADSVTNAIHSWPFSTPANPALSTSSSGPGNPLTATLALGRGASGWLEQVPLGNVEGVWDLGGSGTLRISGLASYSTATQITVRAEQWIDGTLFSAPATTDLSGATLVHSQTSIVQTASLGTWRQYETTWIINKDSTPGDLSLTSPSRGAVLNSLSIQLDGIPVNPVSLTIRTSASPGPSIELSWPSTADEYILENSSSLDPQATWLPVDAPAILVNNLWTLTLDPSASQLFYRLRKK